MIIKTKTFTLFLTILFSSFSYNVYAQTDTDSIQKKKVDTLQVHEAKKLNFGCGFGLNFVGGTNISLSPNLTYNVSNKVAFGLGIQWNYLAIKNIQNTTTYGANSFFQFKPAQKIMTLLEFAQLRVSTKSEIDDSKRNYWDSALFIGVGFNITNKIAIGAKYNLLYDEDESIYSSPVIPFVNISF
jgi:hypothetical protein